MVLAQLVQVSGVGGDLTVLGAVVLVFVFIAQEVRVVRVDVVACEVARAPIVRRDEVRGVDADEILLFERLARVLQGVRREPVGERDRTLPAVLHLRLGQRLKPPSQPALEG